MMNSQKKKTKRNEKRIPIISFITVYYYQIYRLCPCVCTYFKFKIYRGKKFTVPFTVDCGRYMSNQTGEICLLEGSTNPWRISTWCFSPFFWKICRWFSLASMCLDTEFDSTELGHASTIKQDRYSLVMCWRHIRISRHCRSSRAFNYFMFQEGWGKFNLPNFIYISVVE